MNIMDFWSTHGLNDLEEDIQIRRLVRQVAHLQAIADINDRVIGNQSVYYDTFDGTNDHSPGKVDLTKYPINTWITDTNDLIVEFFMEDLTIGQEVSIYSLDGTYLQRTNITGIRPHSTEGFTVISVDQIPHCNKESNTVFIGRSMLDIREGKAYLHPPISLEHDIRINIELGESQTYTLISWVEQEKDMALSNFTATNAPSARVLKSTPSSTILHRPMKVRGKQIDADSVKVSWSNPQGKDYIACVFRNGDQEPIFEGRSATEFIDINPPIGKNTYKVLYKTESAVGSKPSYCNVVFSDTTPPHNVSDVRIGYAYITEESVRMDYTWANPTDKDFKEVFFKVDGEVKYIGTNPYFSFFTDTERTHTIQIGVRDIYGNEQEVTQVSEPVSPLDYWGVKIDFRETSDPTDSVEYIGLAKGITPANNLGLGGWSSTFPFKDIKVCMLDNISGQFLGYVNPNDYSHMEDGSDNVWYKKPTAKTMVEIPTIYTHSYTDDEGVLYVKFSSYKVLDCYTALAHEGMMGTQDYLYISAYPLNKECTCVSGESPVSYSYKVFNNLLSGFYSMWNYSQVDLIQKLFVLAYKSLNSVNSLGKGFTDTPINGMLDNCGLIYGDSSGEGVKFLGMENLWGGMSQYIKNFSLTESGILKSAIGSQSESVMRDVVVLPTDQSIHSVVGDNIHTFVSTNTKHASEGTFFVDRVYMSDNKSSRLGIFNIDLSKAIEPDMWKTTYSPNTSLGVFSTLFVPMNVSDVNNNIGCRCSVLGRR